ncbi:MAG: iron-containing redox enzyme family protein [Dehalococcoidia bacterium]
MKKLEVTAKGVAPSFDEGDPSSAPGATRITSREAFYHLVNVEEHPEVLPLAFDLARQRVIEPARLEGVPLDDVEASVQRLVESLTARRAGLATPWRQAREDLTRRQVLHYFLQYMPTALVDGCWLQCGLRVSTAHTLVGGFLTGLYAHQVRAFIADPGRHFVADYRAAYARLGSHLEEVSSRSFAAREDFLESSFHLPNFLLGIGQFARSFPAEILGLNLAWQYLDLSAFGPQLIRDLCQAYELPSLGTDLGDANHLEKARDMARAAVVAHLRSVEDGSRRAVWERLLRGVNAGVGAWSDWFEAVRRAAPVGPPDLRQEMIDLLWRKAPHAVGYHADKALGSRRIDEHLHPEAFDGPALLDDLARSRWIKPGLADRSGFLRHLVKFGGPMLAVFSPVELKIIESWIDSLPPTKAAADAETAAQSVAGSVPTGPTVREPEYVSGRAWTRARFQSRAQARFGSCSIRELFYYLINVEYHPEILPIAERYARDRLERSLAMLRKGERPIPSWHYDPGALERWVHQKHREQVDGYRVPTKRPPVPKEAFIEASVQLAPIILIDGGWLQGIASPSLIHTEVGRMLFHVLVEEIGEGNAEEHHANIYRELLGAMSEDAPPVDSWEFARWARLRDESFDVPTLWLAISCFPRHFLPEILGLNLAVELAGIGGPYMEARDTLKQFGYPTLFVDVHNAADNVAAGHSAWAMNSIKRFLDGEAEREGPHHLEQTWHRVWSGVRATLPQIGRLRLMTHRFVRRHFGPDPRAIPLIFPS